MKLLHSAVGLFGTAALASNTVDSAMAGHRRACKPGTAVDYLEANSTNVGDGMTSGGAGGIASSAKQHDVTIKGLGIGAIGHHQSLQSHRSPPARSPLELAAA